MTDFEEFGIYEGISEVIFTTISPEGIANAAPVGLHLKDDEFFARLYKSRTLDNIVNNQVAAANITDDPLIFVQSALSDIEQDKFEFIDGFPVLGSATGWIMFDCKCRIGENISVIGLTPVRSKILQRKIKPVNRGFNAVIEAAIHATRYVVLKEQQYLDHIRYYDKIVQKCGGRNEKEAIKLLYDLIGLKEGRR